jgi:hypothetical protein
MVVVDSGNSGHFVAVVGLSQWRQWRHCQLQRRLMAAAMMTFLPPPTMTMTAILALIALALALALPWTRKGQQGGERTMMRLICCCHANPWLHVPLALEYVERVVTTMSEISAIMTGRECSRGLEIWLMLICKKCKCTFWKEGVYIQGNF